MRPHWGLLGLRHERHKQRALRMANETDKALIRVRHQTAAIWSRSTPLPSSSYASSLHYALLSLFLLLSKS